ncbi:MAG: hypothetical protein EKK64_03010 [Neisseriaceae bacterium]|nr:MAG: hypothetical protein EKK64_03010 [Neisseriaceae bacterium]
MNQKEIPVKHQKIVSVSKTEFTTEDGTVHPILFDLDEIPTVEEFQEIYDDWLKVFQEKKLLEEHESEIN